MINLNTLAKWCSVWTKRRLREKLRSSQNTSCLNWPRIWLKIKRNIILSILISCRNRRVNQRKQMWKWTNCRRYMINLSQDRGRKGQINNFCRLNQSKLNFLLIDLPFIASWMPSSTVKPFPQNLSLWVKKTNNFCTKKKWNQNGICSQNKSPC